MPVKPTLAVYGPDQAVKSYMVRVLNASIGHLVEISGYSMDITYPEKLHADLVVSSGRYSYEAATQLFPDSRVIASDRIVTAHNLEQVLVLPRGTRALVVNHPRTTSENTIASLRAFGIDHIEYEPYWREKHCDPSKIDVIITPGLMHWCPPEISVPIINIGERRIGVETFAKILLHFGFDMSYLNAFEQQYIGQHVEASKRIRDLLARSERLRRNQSVILHEIDEGILAMDEKGDIVVSNPIINQLFGEDGQLISNPHLKRILRKLDDEETTHDALSDSSQSTTLLVRHMDKDIYCRKNVIELEEGTQAFYTFKKVEQIEELEHSVRRKMQHKGFSARYTFDDIWGNNDRMMAIKERAQSFAETEHTILITGESGTGKELLAQSIHNASKRAKRPFVATNLAAISQSLLESELFGYQEGAFTGAKKGGKLGMFELAHGGTIFLDEIGDAPLHIQLMLLRVLEMREITRVGGEEPIPIDVRVIAATNCPLEEALVSGKFRQDFYYRLNVLSIKTMPLRDMANEIPTFMAQYYDAKYSCSKELDNEALAMLQNYDWPGNFREFNNALDYIYYSSLKRKEISRSDFPDHILGKSTGVRSFAGLISKNPLVLPVVAVYAENGPQALGRRAVLRSLVSGEIEITEAALKNIVTSLGKIGILSVGTTKQGTCITPHGLKEYRANIAKDD